MALKVSTGRRKGGLSTCFGGGIEAGILQWPSSARGFGLVPGRIPP